MYPKMIYRDGVLSGNPVNQRIVHDEEAELAAAGDGFGEWDGKTKEGAAPVAAAPAAQSLESQQAAFEAAAAPAAQSLESQQAAFEAAAAPAAPAEVEPEPERRPGVARGRRNAG